MTGTYQVTRGADPAADAPILGLEVDSTPGAIRFPLQRRLGAPGNPGSPPATCRLRHAMPASASSTTRWALLTVLSETSYGGETSTTSSATRFASIARRRTVRNRSTGAM